MKQKKLCAIFSISTQNGRFSDFLYYIISDLQKVFTTIIVVVPNNVSEYDCKKLKHEKCFIKESISGYDVDRWKNIISELNQNGQINELDGITILNDSFYGPFETFEKVFSYMECKNLDFWGLTVHGKMPLEIFDKKGILHFIQTYFVNFGTQLIHSKKFIEFWEKLPEFNCYNDTQEKFEYIMTNFFEKLGYKWSVYSDTRDWESIDIEKYMSFLLLAPYDMVKIKRLPIASRYAFKLPMEVIQNYNYGNQISDLIQYLIKIRYPINLIMKDLIFQQNIYELNTKLNMNYILIEKKFNISMRKNNAAIFIYLYYKDQINENIRYLKNIPRVMDVYFFTDTEEKKKEMEKFLHVYRIKCKTKVIIVCSRGREWAALLIEGKQLVLKYKYFCFLHDKKGHSFEYPTVGSSFKTLLWENVIYSRGYINRVIEYFEKNNHIGLLVPPVIKHGTYFRFYNNFWTTCYDETITWAKRLKLETKYISEVYTPISIGSVFWARSEALKDLFQYNFERKDFPEEPMPIDGTVNHVFERIIPYVAQNQGFYTAIIMTKKFAEVDWNICSNMLRKTMSASQKNKNLVFSSFEEYVRELT